MKQQTFKPLFDNMLVEELSIGETARFGVLLPQEAKEKPLLGIVKEVGPGRRLSNGETHPMKYKAGDTIMYGKYCGKAIELNGKPYKVIHSSEILGILKNPEDYEDYNA